MNTMQFVTLPAEAIAACNKAEARRITDMGWKLLLDHPDMTLLEFMHKLECRNWTNNQ